MSSQFMKIPLNGSLSEYFHILIYMAVAFGISLLLVGLSFLRGPRRPNAEKLSPYECGFNAFEDARLKFDVRFYLVAILFIIFDLEIAFLFPWAVSLKEIGLFGSYARNEATSKSDIDFLIELLPYTENYIETKEALREYLSGLFGKNVDLANPRSLKPHFKNRILKQAVYA